MKICCEIVVHTCRSVKIDRIMDGVVEVNAEDAPGVDVAKDKKTHSCIVLLIDPVCYVHIKTEINKEKFDRVRNRNMERYVTEIISTTHCSKTD